MALEQSDVVDRYLRTFEELKNDKKLEGHEDALPIIAATCVSVLFTQRMGELSELEVKRTIYRVAGKETPSYESLMQRRSSPK